MSIAVEAAAVRARRLEPAVYDQAPHADTLGVTPTGFAEVNRTVVATRSGKNFAVGASG